MFRNCKVSKASHLPQSVPQLRPEFCAETVLSKLASGRSDRVVTFAYGEHRWGWINGKGKGGKLAEEKKKQASFSPLATAEIKTEEMQFKDMK